ncbi:mu-type opioid receptor-like [Tubulanus polymorphus]|uniref:mu-type opioid receptor-like n=1 Tax=Tubulanus polymorphus TaxID=672921 RepID=UPI003DA5DAD9
MASGLKWTSFLISVIVHVFGLFGNFASFIIMSFTRMKSYSFSFYLTCLAVSDNAFLTFSLLIWINRGFRLFGLAIPIVAESDIACRFIEYVPMAFRNSSTWFICLICLERLVAVALPFMARRLCRRSTAKYVSYFTFVAAFLSISYLPAVVRYRPGVGCTFDTSIVSLFLHFQLFNVLGLYLPVSIIVTCNVVIVIVLKRTIGEGKGGSKAEKSSQVTVMLLITSTAFVLLTAPDALFHIIVPVFPEHGFLAAVDEFLVVFYCTNFAVNFYLYTITGSEVRRTMIRGLRIVCKMS